MFLIKSSVSSSLSIAHLELNSSVVGEYILTALHILSYGVSFSIPLSSDDVSSLQYDSTKSIDSCSSKMCVVLQSVSMIRGLILWVDAVFSGGATLVHFPSCRQSN